MSRAEGEKEQVCTSCPLSDTDLLMIACLTTKPPSLPHPMKNNHSHCVGGSHQCDGDCCSNSIIDLLLQLHLLSALEARSIDSGL